MQSYICPYPSSLSTNMKTLQHQSFLGPVVCLTSAHLLFIACMMSFSVAFPFLYSKQNSAIQNEQIKESITNKLKYRLHLLIKSICNFSSLILEWQENWYPSNFREKQNRQLTNYCTILQVSVFRWSKS